ncbi:hypothetical protein CLV58_109148 [Spirosoma oryzae]|uniref:Uncharacterized protein n=1 Tax=Spirosoma oryzae TaxID=1469603 RepID=A0A2T0SYB3_9BACT|nr:hypothetical protein [Spirosoma oryzae]PRY38421.1 hypothetical protein CLV58_109148 [Spirosoma oryzae]
MISEKLKQALSHVEQSDEERLKHREALLEHYNGLLETLESGSSTAEGVRQIIKLITTQVTELKNEQS